MTKYHAIYNQLKEGILSHKYQPNSFLPTEDELVSIYNASKTTIRKALKLLKNDGYIAPQQGRGTLVLPMKTHRVGFSRYNNVSAVQPIFYGEEAAKHSIETSNGAIDTVKANKLCAVRLGIKEGDDVFRLQRLQKVDGNVFSYHVAYVRKDKVPHFDEHNIVSNLYDFLSQEYGLTATMGEEYIRCEATGFKEAQFLHVDIGFPALVLGHIFINHAGPFCYSETWARSDIFQIKFVSDRLNIM